MKVVPAVFSRSPMCLADYVKGERAFVPQSDRFGRYRVTRKAHPRR